jgi:hypothetical protein
MDESKILSKKQFFRVWEGISTIKAKKEINLKNKKLFSHKKPSKGSKIGWL